MDAILDLLRHWYRHVWLLDFEFHQPAGHRPIPLCLVAKDILSGKEIRVWLYGVPQPVCPFTCDENNLFIAYTFTAEASCFVALQWPRPIMAIDFFTEFRNLCNGHEQFGYSLLDALTYFGLPSIGYAEKEEMRALAIRGGPYTAEERAALDVYCATDVQALEALLGPLFAGANLADPREHGRALLRARAMIATAQIEANGIPIDQPLFERIRDNLPAIQRALVEAVDRDFGVFENGVCKLDLLEALVARRGYDWPRCSSGRLSLTDDVFKDLVALYPELASLRELRALLGQTRLHNLPLGPDGRNRCSLRPFWTKTGRNGPRGSEFIFSMSCWLRGLIRPPEGRALVYADYASQEIAVSAAIFGDEALWQAYESGDVYWDFAIRSGLAPPGATRETHADVRDRCKICSWVSATEWAHADWRVALAFPSTMRSIY